MVTLLEKKCTTVGIMIGKNMADNLERGYNPKTMMDCYRGHMSAAYNMINTTCPNRSEVPNRFRDVKNASEFVLSARGIDPKTFTRI